MIFGNTHIFTIYNLEINYQLTHGPGEVGGFELKKILGSDSPL